MASDLNVEVLTTSADVDAKPPHEHCLSQSWQCQLLAVNHLDPLGLQTLDLPCDQYDGINLSIDSLTAELAGTYDYKLTVSIETSQADYPLFTERTIRVDIALEQVVSDFLD